MRCIYVGSRASDLSRIQTKHLLEQVKRLSPDLEFKHRVISTTGDRDRKTSLRDISGDAAFAKELETALLNKEIDLAVHSLKDVRTTLPEGLRLAAVPKREEIRDALCGAQLEELASGARVGTGSPRRQAQLLHLRPDIKVVPIRGNVPPRLRRIRGSNPLDAVILAAAGLRRLGMEEHITELLPLEKYPPSPGQGALGLEIRGADTELYEILMAINDPASEIAVRAERALLNELHGGCSVPIGGYGIVEGESLRLCAQVTSLDGSKCISKALVGRITEPEETGRKLAGMLLQDGADEILNSIQRTE